MLKGVARFFRSFSAVLLLAAFGSVTQAATHQVIIRDGFFEPAVTNVLVGDTIQWVHHGSGFHTTTSKTGEWDSSILLPGEAFEYTFTTNGTFEYFSSTDTGMEGRVIVESGFTISIASPAPNARFTPGTNVNVQVSVADPTNGVTELRLSIAHNGVTTVMTNATNNFEFVIPGVAQGTYTLTASASGSGVTKSSSAVTIHVGDVGPTPDGPRIISIGLTNNNNTVIRVSTTSTAEHEILASSSVGTNASWAVIGKATTTSGTFDFVDTTANENTRRFYRIRVAGGGGGNPGAAPHISGLQRAANGAITLTITSGRTGTHTIQASTTLAEGSWAPIGTATGNGGTLTFTDNDAPTIARRFYRVSAQ